ncbi:unnamed protein product [Ixodes pacificus]
MLLVLLRLWVPSSALSFTYHELGEVNAYLTRLASENRELVTLQLLGKTWKGRNIWQVMLSRRAKEDALIPHVHIIANIYGNDPVTREVALQLVDYVVENKQKDQDVAWLLDNARLSVVPSVNVDGSDASIPGECIGMVGDIKMAPKKKIYIFLEPILLRAGVRGTVMNRRSEPIARALLTIHNRTVGFRTNEHGEFWRILLPGSYTLLASADGYLPAAMDFQVVSKQATTLEVKLYSGYRYET